MKTVAIFSAYYLPHLGGVERYTYNLAKKLKERGYKIVIVTSQYEEQLSEIEETEYAKIYRLPTYKIASNRYPINRQNKRCKELLKMVADEKIDSVILQTRFWITSYIGAKFAKKNNLPAYVIEHGSAHFTVNHKILDFFGAIYEHILTNLIKKNVKNFYGVSQKCNEWLKHFKIDAKGVFYNSVDADAMKEYQKYINKSEDKLRITFIGRMIEEKGVLRLIEAFKKLNDQYENLELNLAGDGPILERVKEENKNVENINILGKISHEEAIQLLGKTSIFVNPSHFSEGLPTTILEAGMMECSVVATPMGGTTEIISSDDIGYICGVDTEEIQEKIEKLILHQDEIKKLGKNIKAKIEKEFSWDVTANKIVNTIQAE